MIGRAANNKKGRPFLDDEKVSLYFILSQRKHFSG